MPTTILKTKDGVLDDADRSKLDELLVRLKQGAPLHLHLHGGLVDEAAGLGIANRLSGSAADGGFGAPADWEQVYIVWRTGGFETIRTNWIDLFDNDRLYKALLRKALAFVGDKLKLPVEAGGRSVSTAVGLSEQEVQRRLDARPPGDPFQDVDLQMGGKDPASRSVVGPASASQAAAEFEGRILNDPEMTAAADDLAAWLTFEPAQGRSAARVGDSDEGRRAYGRLDKKIQAELDQIVPPVGMARTAFTGAGLLIKIAKHAAKIAWRVFKRYRAKRDHGFYATVVEELARELYGDRVGAIVWGMMVKDAADHFKSGGMGEALLATIDAAPVTRITAHSAGSIWASELLSKLDPNGPASLRIGLLAPAVRTDKFAKAVQHGQSRIESLRMFTMHDALEREDAVLGGRWSYVYPSSLLYLVSGAFEQVDADAFVDAPLLGLERFHDTSATWLTVEERNDISMATGLISAKGRIVYSKSEAGNGLNTVATSHGGFDQDPKTLASLIHYLRK